MCGFTKTATRRCVTDQLHEFPARLTACSSSLPSDAQNIGCDPDDYPTAKYIERYKEGYSDYNMQVPSFSLVLLSSFSTKTKHPPHLCFPLSARPGTR